jgi:hypothetical protein
VLEVELDEIVVDVNDVWLEGVNDGAIIPAAN